MSDGPRDAVNELAAKLFAAARAERPGPALARRLSLIQPSGADEAGSAVHASGEEHALVGLREGAAGARGNAAPAAGASVSGERAHSGMRELSSTRQLAFAHERRGLSLPSRWGVGLAALAVAAGMLGVFWSGAAEDAVRISAEQGVERAHGPTPAAMALDAPSMKAEVLEGEPARASLPRLGGQRSLASGARPRIEGALDEARSSTRTTTGSTASASRGVAPKSTSTADTGGRTSDGSVASSVRAALEPAVAGAAAASATNPSPAVATVAEPMTLGGELALLKDARAALRAGDANHSLALLDRHAAAHTANGLLDEATVLRIETLAALGRAGEASELADRFVRDNPHSALSDRAKSFIGGAKNGAP